jgi:transcriptional regulator with XRE-family HTH domain
VRRILYWAEKAGINRHQLALRVGINDSNVYHWQAGRHLPSREVIERCAEVCGVSMSRFWSSRISI